MALNNRSIYFNPPSGQTSYIKLGGSGTNPTIKNLDNFTWMAWVKSDVSRNTSLSQRLYVERQGLTKPNLVRFAAVPSKDRIRFELAVTDGQADTNYDYLFTWDQRWHHIAFVGKITGTSPSYEIYLDSLKVAEGTLRKTSGIDNISNTNPLGNTCYLGNVSYHGTGPETFLTGNQWYGKIDDIVIFNTAISQSELQTYITDKDLLSTGDPDMISYWIFDETSGTTTTDADNPTWTGSLILNGSASSTLRDIDRPYLGNGTNDTSAPSPAPTATGSPTTAVTTDGFTMNINVGTDNVKIQNVEFQVDTNNTFSSYTAYTVPYGFATASTLSLPISGQLPNQVYYWRARTIDEALNVTANWGSPQTTTTLSTVATPKPPSNVVISNTDYDSFDITITMQSQDIDNNALTIAGFKVDVATNSNFSLYKSGWKNNDVGNDTTLTVTGLTELTTYYVRVRQYTAAGTESVSTTPVIAITSSAPDLVAPLPVTAEDATSVDARAFTAHWEQGQDNIGVVDYQFDLATDSAFTQYIHSGVSTGNVTDLHVTGLTPSTTYYYRTRAVDAAGNISPNNNFVEVTTATVGVEDGGFVTVQSETSADTYVDSALPTTVFGSGTQDSLSGNGSSATKIKYTQFDLTTIPTSPTSAQLWLFVTSNNNTSASITVQASTTQTINETTTHYNNRPVVTGTSTTFTIPGTQQWVGVDVSQFVTGAGTYLFQLSVTANAAFAFYTREATTGPGAGLAPYLSIEYDPSVMLKPDQIFVEEGPNTHVNHSVNPNAEGNVTTGWTATASNTLTINATAGLNSTKAFQNVIVSTGTGPVGMQTTTPINVVTGEVVFVSGYAKTLTTDETVVVTCQGLTSGNSLVDTTELSSSAITADHLPFLGFYSVTNPTVAKVRITIGGALNNAGTFYFDNILIRKDNVLSNPGLLFGVPGYFDGTVGGYEGFWQGTTNLSASTRFAPSFEVHGTYLGDSNENASAVVYFKKTDETDWISVYQNLQIYGNSVTNEFQATLGPTFGNYNMIRNPSFEVNTTGWNTVGAGVVLTRDEGDAVSGTACGKVVTTANANVGIITQRVYISSFAADSVHGRAKVKAPSGTTVNLLVRPYNAANSALTVSTPVFGTSQIAGNDEWQDIEVTYTLPVGSYSYELAILQSTATIKTIWVDSVLTGEGDYINPYRDGTSEDAYFEGTAHNSNTALFILPNEQYDLRVELVDPDGIIDAVGTTVNLSTQYTTPLPQDYRTIINEITHPIVVVSTEDKISFDLPFLGDDQGGGSPMTATVEYKRSDQFAWQLSSHIIDRVNNIIHSDIENLNPGTSYDVRIIISDPDGVSGLLNNTKTYTTATQYYGDAINTPSIITFGGFLLHNESLGTPLKTFVIRHDAFGFPDRRLDIQEIPKSDGSIELGALWGKRTINIRGIVYGDSRNEVISALDQMKLGMIGRQQPLIINTFSNTNRRYFATCRSIDIVEEGGKNFRHLEWDAVFECADPFAYSATTLTQGPTQVKLNGQQITVTNTGGLESYPIIRISTKSSSRITPILLSTLTNERIIPEKGMVTDDVLVIDSSSNSVYMNGVDIGYTGLFPILYAGDNTFQFDAYRGPTSANIYVTVQWVERYI